MLTHCDIHGYYRLLGIKPQVDNDAIKQAYRKLAKDIHPDHHRLDQCATAKFQRLAEAYETLGNPQRRREYDSASLFAFHYEVRPLACDCCGKISPQLRYAVFPYVLGLSFARPCRTFEGLYCSQCAQTKALQAVILTWLLGWWRVPRGPFLSAGALFKILMDDSYPVDKNTDLLMQQATYYFSAGQMELAGDVLSHVEQFVTTGIASQKFAELRRYIPVSRLPRDDWKIRRRWSFLIQLAPLAVVSFAAIAISLSLYGVKNSAQVVAQQRQGGIIVIDARGPNNR
jgi:hypothetical protein